MPIKSSGDNFYMQGRNLRAPYGNGIAVLLLNKSLLDVFPLNRSGRAGEEE